MNWYEQQAADLLHDRGINDDDFDIIEGSGEDATTDEGRWVTALIWVYDPSTDEDKDERQTE